MLTKVVKPAYKSLVSTLLLPAVPSPQVIILGNQKSGTTAIAALLAKYIGQSVTLDINTLWGENEAKIHTGRLSLLDFALSNKYDFSRTLVKEPCLTFLVPQVRETFPKAKLLFIVRDPRDNIRSILNRLSLPGHLEQLPANTHLSLTNGWEYVLDGAWMGLQGNSYIEMLAARWNRAVDHYFEQQAAIHLVRYEDFQTDKATTIEAIATELGFMQRREVTKFLQVQFQPKGNPSVKWQEFFDTNNLQAIEQLCAANMRRLEYPL